MAKSKSIPACTKFNDLTAFNAPFLSSRRQSPWSSKCACSWSARPTFHAARSSFAGNWVIGRVKRHPKECDSLRVTPRAMFSGSGILGVGPSEVFVIVTVGWLLLGPDKMVKLAKDAGQLLGRVRRTADEAKDSLKDAIDLDMLSEEANAIKTEFEAAAAGITEPRKRKGETKESAKDSGKGSVKDSAKGLEDDVAEAMPGIADMGESDLTKEMGAPMTAEAQMPAPNGEVKPGLDAGGSSAFLDQLRRVADPNQVAPAEIQDLETEVQENEVERLEREYLAAKEKLENRRRERAKVDGRDDTNHGTGER